MLKNIKILNNLKKISALSELKVFSFLDVDFHNIINIDNFYCKMGNSFIDISSEPESLKQWEQVKLTKIKNKHMLAFKTINSYYCEL